MERHNREYGPSTEIHRHIPKLMITAGSLQLINTSGYERLATLVVESSSTGPQVPHRTNTLASASVLAVAADFALYRAYVHFRMCAEVF